MKVPKTNYAFIDGSFDQKTGIYGCGGFLIDQHGAKHILQKAGDDKAMAKMRNVAGEILGAVLAVKTANKLHMKKLTLFHDYEGIAKWPIGAWKTNKAETKKYADFMKKAMKNGLNLYFVHVKGHSGIAGNEEADQLAKLAVEIASKSRR